MFRKRLCIFIVDDDESVCRSIRRLLISAGFKADTFASAQTFLDSVPPETEGILVLDIRMPEIDGFEFQKKLVSCGSPLKIIFITAYAQPGDREYAMQTGAIGFLQKPFDDQSLLNLIHSTMKAKKE